MGRIRIEMPEKFVYVTQVNVRISDINFGCHVGHDAFVTILHEARARFFRSLNYEETNIEGQAIMVADLAVVYKSEAFFPGALDIQIGAGDFNKYGCDLIYRATDAESGTLVLEAKTGIVFVDPVKRKVAPVPEAFVSSITPA